MFLPLPTSATVGKIQLWAELERKAAELDLQMTETFLFYAESDGDGNGKVYGGCLGRSSTRHTTGQWWVVFAYGPIGAAKIRASDVKRCAGEGTARHIFSQKYVGKLGKYSPDWPGERRDFTVSECLACGVYHASGAHCHICDPRRAKADSEVFAWADSRQIISRPSKLPVKKPKATAPEKKSDKPKPKPERDVLDDFGTEKIRW